MRSLPLIDRAAVQAMLVAFAQVCQPGRFAVLANERTWQALGGNPVSEVIVGRGEATNEYGTSTVLPPHCGGDRGMWIIRFRQEFGPGTLGERYGVRLTVTAKFEMIWDDELPDGFVAAGRANSENVVLVERGVHGSLPS